MPRSLPGGEAGPDGRAGCCAASARVGAGNGSTRRVCVMKSESMRARMSGNETLYGGWVVIGDVTAVAAIAGAGLDYVCIDLQHGGATESDLPALTTAIRGAGAEPVARVRHAH